MRIETRYFISILAILSQLALIKAYQQNDSSTVSLAPTSRTPNATTNSITLASEGGGTGAGLGESESEAEGGLVFNNPSLIRPNTDPDNRIDIVQKARKNEFSSMMITNRTKALVSCETGEILVKINFTEPFRGVAYADYDRTSPCKFFGDGETYYEMRLPLKGCGTKQEAPRLFVNNIVLRFHRSLELEEDEEKTIVCRYPPPQAPPPPPPPGPPAKIIEALPEPARLTQYEPFALIAGLLFFTLLLAGMGITNRVYKKESIKPINTPLPITSQTEYDNYIDTQSVKTIEDLQTTHKLMTLPKLSSHTFDDVYITNIHEIDTIEDLTHQKQMLPKAKLEYQNFEDVHITNQDEIVNNELLQHQRLMAPQRRLDRQDCDDTYITNQDEIIEDELITHHKLMRDKPRLEVRTIEDTFITNVDEIVEEEDTTYLKGHSNRCYEPDSYEHHDGQLEHDDQYHYHHSGSRH